jgi:hypothetical protein
MLGFPKPGLPWPDVDLDPFQQLLRTAATEVIAREASAKVFGGLADKTASIGGIEQ